MKIIDDRGRLFGKINIIDFMAVLILVSFIPMLYLGYRILNQNKIMETKSVSVKVRFSDVTPELSKVINEGDVERNELDSVIGKIKKIIDIKPSVEVIIMDNKIINLGAHPLKKDIFVMLDLLCIKKGRRFFYNDSLIAIGNPIKFSTDFYTVNGIIVDFKRDQDEYNL